MKIGDALYVLVNKETCQVLGDGECSSISTMSLDEYYGASEGENQEELNEARKQNMEFLASINNIPVEQIQEVKCVLKRIDREERDALLEDLALAIYREETLLWAEERLKALGLWPAQKIKNNV